MNGRIDALSPQGFSVTVEQSFGNCPQYIQAREPILVDTGSAGPIEREDALLSPEALALIRRSDTFFIASSAGLPDAESRHGIDVSHRGGKPGFVLVEEKTGASVLTVPDFRGNNFFNTLGNILRYPQAGLLFIDFETGDVLQLTGEAEVLLDDPSIATFPGASRLLRCRITKGQFLRKALPLRWSTAIPAPQLEKTGRWAR